MHTRRAPPPIVAALACVGALAGAACSGGSLTPDPGTGGSGGSGSAGCDHPARITTCSSNPGTLPADPEQTSPCTVEGASCQATRCFDFGEMTFVTTCCAGSWRPNFAGPCPGFQPGDPFACAADLSCAIGQTYCSSSNADRTVTFARSCQPICAVGDCTCFCGKAEGCDFKPPGSTCPADVCHCSAVTVGPNIRVPGAVMVECDYVVPGSDACYPDTSVDGRCGGGRYAVFCAGGADGLPDGCTPLSEPGTTASCGGAINYYCCS